MQKYLKKDHNYDEYHLLTSIHIRTCIFTSTLNSMNTITTAVSHYNVNEISKRLIKLV